MKKILVTTLALSLAVISTIDARNMGDTTATTKRVRARRSVVAPSGTTKDLAANIKAQAEQVDNAPRNQKDAATQELLQLLMENPDIAHLAKLELEAKVLANNLEKEKATLALTKTGWFFNTQEYKDQQAIVNEVNTKLKDKKKQIAAARAALIKKESSPVTAQATIVGVTAAVAAIGAIAALEYWFGGKEESYTGQAMTYSGKQLKRASDYASENVINPARASFEENVAAPVRNWYNKPVAD